MGAELKVSLKGIAGKWNKYGTDPSNPITNQHHLEELRNGWYCQSCGKFQPPELNPYIWNVGDDIFLRICRNCLKDGCVVVVERHYHGC